MAHDALAHLEGGLREEQPRPQALAQHRPAQLDAGRVGALDAGELEGQLEVDLALGLGLEGEAQLQLAARGHHDAVQPLLGHLLRPRVRVRVRVRVRHLG